jgi:DeoR/GlpR family transcriptional regulator of sugar metabolism
MLKEERLKTIIDRVQEEARVLVTDLSRAFGVSEMTIRRDLQELETSGWVDRVHGGALLSKRQKNRLEPPALERMGSMMAEKKRIADYIVSLVQPSEMLFIGSGTTTLYIAQALSGRDDITVVSNALPILNELGANSKMTLIGVGGFLRRDELSMIGSLAEAEIRNLRVDKVIIGMRGIHPEHGLTSDHPQEILTDRQIMSISDTVIVAADHTKIGQVASSITAPIERANLIVSSTGADARLIREIEKKGSQVVLV